MHLDNIIGMSLRDAASVLNDMDLSFRIVERDGVPAYVPDPKIRAGRVNLRMATNVVKSYYIG